MTTTGIAAQPVRIAAHRRVTKRLGNWTATRTFQVRAHRGVAVVDLRSPQIPAGDIEIDADLDRATLTLLVPEDAQIEDWDLRRTGRSKVKDSERPAVPGDRRIVVSGELRSSEIRVRRGGFAVLTAIFSREFLADARRARAAGERPTVADPGNVA